jgi:hypothetical protein
MEDTRKIFLQNVNEFIIFSNNTPDKNTIKSRYLELVKKYHPDVNNDIDKNILNEYMVIINNMFEKTANRKFENYKHKNKANNIFKFNFDTFCQILSKIMEVGIDEETIKNQIFKEYVKLLLLEMEKSNKHVSEAFQIIISEEAIMEYRHKIKLLNDGMANYLHLLKSTPSSTKEKYRKIPDINIANKQTEKIADSYLVEFKNYCKKDIEKDSIDLIMKWFKVINKEYHIK